MSRIMVSYRRYGNSNTYIPLFLCNWVKLTAITKDQYGMTIVDLCKTGYSDEPFVVANDVHQVFYVKDMSRKPKRNP